MGKKLLFVYNPKAGTGSIAGHLSEIIELFSKEGYRVEVFPTACRDDAKKRIMKCEEDFDLIVISGGDGTLNEAVTGCLESGKNIPIGYIPAGSTNDFASSLNIPKQPLAAAKEIVSGEQVDLDVGLFNDRHFVYVAAFGIFTSVAYATDQVLKNTFGHMAYLIKGLKELNEIRAYNVSFDIDGNTRSGRYIYGMVTNSKSVGGIKNITGENVELSDGLFEVTLIKEPDSLIRIPEIIAALIAKNIESEYIEKYSVSEINFETEEALQWTIDGEFGGECTEVRIVNLHNMLKMML